MIAPPDDNLPNTCVCNIPVRNEAPFWLPDPGDCATCDRPIRTEVSGTPFPDHDLVVPGVDPIFFLVCPECETRFETQREMYEHWVSCVDIDTHA